MVFAIRNQNEQFLRYALFNSLFGSNFFNHKPVRDEILAQLQTRAKTEFILNILIFADFSRWPQIDLQSFIECIEEM